MSLGLAKASQCKAQVSKKKEERIGAPEKTRVVAGCAGFDAAVYPACTFTVFVAQ